MGNTFHYPPELFKLLVDTIPLLCRSKKDVTLFLQGAGVSSEDIKDVEYTVRTMPKTINKYCIVQTVLERINQRGDNGLRVRREILKRVTEFESFELCWPEEQYKAKGLVTSIREVVNKKDAFTRMKKERDDERESRVMKQREKQAKLNKKKDEIDKINHRLSALFSMNDEPQKRGKLLESILNDLFRVYEIHIHEDFKRKAPDSNIVLEQIDGVIELNNKLHLVEMKWLNEPVGKADISHHLVRLFSRANVDGIFISSNGYTKPAIDECKNALSQKTIFLCTLQEFVILLNRQDDLISFLKRKSQAAVLEHNPFLLIT